MEYRIISADDHIDMQWLPRDLWRKRVPQSWRDRAPKVVETADGPYWVCWAVYDVSIEGISLIGNYRTQFNAVIQRSGYPDLVAKLRAKQDERPGAREAGRPEPIVPTVPTVAPVTHSRQSP